MNLMRYRVTVMHDPPTATGRPLHERCEVYRAEDVRAVMKEMKDHLEHVQEYWNGSPNERAMQDALEHILSETEKMLTRLQEIAP